VTVHYTDDRVTLYHGDCIEVMRTLPDASVDAVVTDPPYGLSFMGKDWDNGGKMLGQMATGDEQRGAFAYGGSHDRGYADNDSVGFQAFSYAWATEALRVLKPGGHLLAFGGTRTWHRLAVAIEDAGFEVRDSIAWMYGSGFPKSLDVSKAIDKGAGAQRMPSGAYTSTACDFIQRGAECPGHGDESSLSSTVIHTLPTAPATPAAQQWQGWGTALKPAFEPIVVARKPLIGTVAANVLKHGTGALNIDGCRIGTEARTFDSKGIKPGSGNYVGDNWDRDQNLVSVSGRWPANVILDESQAAALDAQSGDRLGMRTQRDNKTHDSSFHGYLKSNIVAGETREGYNDTGGASRFFYTAKANSSERPNVDGVAHPTVKPLDLMRYLVRLVTPPGGTVLEPFAGSGTTAEACIIEGFKCIAIEMTDEYLPLILDRITKPIETVMF
jgi:site-specific DNA-methyltransferase (adenine-specific)